LTRPRVLIGIFGLDSHELGSVAVASLLRDAGMEVVYAGRYQTPEGLVRIANQEDLDVIGLSCHSWEYLEYMPALLKGLADAELDVKVVAGGSVITPADADNLTAMGVAAVFGSGSDPEAMIATIRELAEARHQARAAHASR
jgi:methylmalonyl-CoA mutase C-terminal domain/subunit